MVGQFRVVDGENVHVRQADQQLAHAHRGHTPQGLHGGTLVWEPPIPRAPVPRAVDPLKRPHTPLRSKSATKTRYSPSRPSAHRIRPCSRAHVPTSGPPPAVRSSASAHCRTQLWKGSSAHCRTQLWKGSRAPAPPGAIAARPAGGTSGAVPPGIACAPSRAACLRPLVGRLPAPLPKACSDLVGWGDLNSRPLRPERASARTTRSGRSARRRTTRSGAHVTGWALAGCWQWPRARLHPTSVQRLWAGAETCRPRCVGSDLGKGLLPKPSGQRTTLKKAAVSLLVVFKASRVDLTATPTRHSAPHAAPSGRTGTSPTFPSRSRERFRSCRTTSS
jgi:hypothetical protein